MDGTRLSEGKNKDNIDQLNDPTNKKASFPGTNYVVHLREVVSSRLSFNLFKHTLKLWRIVRVVEYLLLLRRILEKQLLKIKTISRL